VDSFVGSRTPRCFSRISELSATNSPRVQERDAVIIGGGLAGLSAALYLSQMDPARHITILDREDAKNRPSSTTVASFAAAGMLAPQAERLPKGPLLDLCIQSRGMYRDFCDMVEGLARESDEDASQYLSESVGSLKPWNVGYMAQGGFLAPAFAGDTVATWSPPSESGIATWLDATQARELEPHLHPDVVGGWWFPEDASVDATRLTCSLRAACVTAGVQFLSGKDYEVSSLDLGGGECKGLWLKNGKYIQTKSLLVANGAWMRTLLPVPIEPHKGQSISLRTPADQPPILQRVLFAQDSYIVPKADGRIVIGATVEAGSFDPNVTPAGVMHILTHALQLVPALRDLPIEETWAGLRPTTPDKGPILGETPWKNLFLAGGYWRNGVLLAPKTGMLLAALMSNSKLEDSDRDLLNAFSWDRFTSEDSRNYLAASSRYAASMHPIHSRKSGIGVAASVGTELGSYSSARSAVEERKLERDSLFHRENEEIEASFEKAAALGKSDGKVFKFDGDNESVQVAATFSYEGSADAFTVSSAETESDIVNGYHNHKDSKQELEDGSDIQAAYRAIERNKDSENVEMLEEDEEEEEMPDPGFRIYHIDDDGVRREVPPYTRPDVFLASIKTSQSRTQVEAETTDTATEEEDSSNNEQTFDGYQAIVNANSATDREAELEAMKRARAQNRREDDIDESIIGVRRINPIT